MSLRYLPLAAFLALAFFFALMLKSGKDPSVLQSVMIGRPAPEFDLSDGLSHETGFSTEDLKGSPSIVNVFASWCVTCRLEQGILEEIGHDEDIPVFGINYKDKPEKLAEWLQTYGDPYNAIGADPDGRVAIAWGVYGVPETFVVDAKGIIRYKITGALTDKIYQDEIKPLLAELKKQ